MSLKNNLYRRAAIAAQASSERARDRAWSGVMNPSIDGFSSGWLRFRKRVEPRKRLAKARSGSHEMLNEFEEFLARS
jgi:hypothetical protein